MNLGVILLGIMPMAAGCGGAANLTQDRDATPKAVETTAQATTPISAVVQTPTADQTAFEVVTPTATADGGLSATADGGLSAATAAPPATPSPTTIADPPTTASLGDIWLRPGDDMEMVYVPAGQFQMGSTEEQVDQAFELCLATFGSSCSRYWYVREMPAHAVALDGFWIDRTEVTNDQYRLCVQAGACEPPGMEGYSKRDAYWPDASYGDYPVTYVTWDSAADYCQWADGRLPTEAEWEYAARGPESLLYPWGMNFHVQYLNYCDASCIMDWADDAIDDGYAEAAPVGSYPQGASWCGALDMAGNVWEWTADWLDYEYYSRSPERNPLGPETGEARVIRGGAWGTYAASVRSAYRGTSYPFSAQDPLGFRCAWGEARR